jgi:glutamyl-tRNA synthetase
VSALQGITRGADGSVTSLSGDLNLAGDVKKTKLKLTWLADIPELVPLTLVDFDYLITKKKVSRERGYFTGSGGG